MSCTNNNCQIRILVSIFLILTALLCSTAMADSSVDYESMFTINRYGTIIDYCGTETDLVIPETINGFTVRAIGEDVFQQDPILESITLPKTLTAIEGFAFWECPNLKEVYADSLDQWLNISFDSQGNPLCNGGKLYFANELVTDIVIPDGITSIGNYAFEGCTSLNSIILPESVYSIGELAFSNCSNLNNVTFHEGISTIGIRAFESCNSLTNVILPDSIDIIEYGAFRHCRSLQNIVLPDELTRINNAIFERCESLTSIVIPEGITTLGSYTFSYCTSLTSISLPESIVSLEHSVFMGCKSLNSVSLPKGLNTIGIQAFHSCESLVSLSIPDSVTKIGYGAFAGCRSLISLSIPDSVTEIEGNAFSYCTSLISIDLPETWITIGEYTFMGCRSLTQIDIPETVVFIDTSAFEQCSSLTHVSIPASVTEIGKRAFYGCEHLLSISISNVVVTIDPNAFAQNGALKYIMLLDDDIPAFRPSNLWNLGIYTIYCYEYTKIDYWAASYGFDVVYLDDLDMSKPLEITLPADYKIKAGTATPIFAGIFPPNKNAIIEWSSSDPEVVAIENGLMLPLSTGRAAITAACGDISDTMYVTVYTAPKSFNLSKEEIWVVAKETAHISIDDILPVEAEHSFWGENSDFEICTININDTDIKINAKVPGDAVLTIFSEDCKSPRECIVHVCYPVTSISFDSDQLEVLCGFKYRIKANVTTRNQNLMNRLVSFESSNESVITVDEWGMLTPIKPGSAVIKARSTNGLEANCTVTVKQADIFNLPSNLKIVKQEAFAMANIDAIILPSGCTTIEERAFAECKDLQCIHMPDSVTSISENAFYGCENVVFHCESENNAAAYAKEFGIEYLIE